jgi:3-oxoacyl-[acyl-carrier-protein] synthase I
MRRVVITGMGAASSLGLDLTTIEQNLRKGTSGISYHPDYEAHGFNSLVSGWIKEWRPADVLPRKAIKTMGRGSEFTSFAGLQALQDSGLHETDVRSDRCGVIVGCAEASARDMFEAALAMQEHNKPRRIGIRVPKTMASSRSANLTLLLKNQGMSLAISDACATGLANIGYAYQVIKWGVQDVILAGGGDSADWAGGAFFDAMGVLSCGYNDTPEAASRPFDKDRDGFIMSEGGGIVVVEELDHARARGARIYGEIMGYATNCDGGYSMVAPNPDGATRCVQAALADAGLKPQEIDYINTHGTSTVTGDPSEITAIHRVFQEHRPMVTSTKSQIGHTIGAAGALELIASLVMLNGGFIAPSLNLDQVDDECVYDHFVTQPRQVNFNTFLTNNFAFGGSNASMVVRGIGVRE